MHKEKQVMSQTKNTKSYTHIWGKIENMLECGGRAKIKYIF
jgi:uncharacterized lipoprotein NlpE involved in copper resistance